ncbi:AraC family transcriptional regulator [Mesorhizobium sp. L-8-10]|uniref:helix-turn-helix domain-containing protein n=1 Tax=unclassified Mesorhizobium TaxID=325217 RepID=UPI001926117D|nr:MULTISPECIES: AraC family transcriptional regulator [unclassified Mesorhizobium]BCH25133.1 AraC family transcriptional regulator [Mesorhizobium sp. L-8-3]BCH32890.1 AraC family transcriptional regulator [Mesorhizobium sp. L-8-10]
MTVTASILASGPGWQVSDIVCAAGVGDRPFEEQHRSFCVAAVTHGTFRYRASLGTAIMAPGALLLGNPGTCFECGHDHSAGDRCLSFHFSPSYIEAVAAELPGVSRLGFGTPRLPPVAALAPLLADAEAARDDGDIGAFEELGLRLSGAAVSIANHEPKRDRAPSTRDEKRVSEALRRIEADADQTISIDGLASETATSPYHFLRSFRTVTGMTPYQYLLRTRLQRAAVRLRTSDEPVASIAFDAGFGDLSTFNRRFRRIMGATPSDYRRRKAPAGPDRKP